LYQLRGDVPALLDGWTLVVHFSSSVALVVVGPMSSVPSIAPVSGIRPTQVEADHSLPRARRKCATYILIHHRAEWSRDCEIAVLSDVALAPT
jgi:hypothetical protein